MQRLDAHEVARDEVEPAPRLELRPRRRVALDLREGVEGAPLDPGARPGLAHGLGEPAPAVGDDHLGRRDRRHEGRPRPRVLRPRHVPGDHPLAAAAYEHDEVARDPDPVDVEHAVQLAVGDGHRPDLPELGRPAPEGPPAARHRRLGVLGEEPPEELPASSPCRRTSPSSTRRRPCTSTAGTPMRSCRCAWSDRRSRGNKRPSWAPLPKGYLTVPEKVIYQRERWATGHTFCPSG